MAEWFKIVRNDALVNAWEKLGIIQPIPDQHFFKVMQWRGDVAGGYLFDGETGCFGYPEESQIWIGTVPLASLVECEPDAEFEALLADCRQRFKDMVDE